MSGKLATYLVQFPQPSGVEMNVHLVLDEKPTRQDQKLKTLSKYIQKYPQGWKKRLELADLLYTMGSWEQAIAQYRQVIERSPQLISVRLQLGKILQMMKREAEAIELYGSALTLSCNQGTQHHINGLIAVCKGESQKAIIAFDSAADLEPDKIVHWLALGQVQKGRENPIGALRAFSRVLSLNPEDIVALIHSYDMLMAVGDFQEARQRLSKAIALAPDDFRVLQRQLDQRCGMGLVSGEEGKQTKKLIGSVLRQTPHAAEAYKSLAYYHIYRGDWAQGVGVLAEFTEEHPNNPSGWYYYGQCLFHTGENQAAAEMMLKAYGLYPDDCEIYRALCKILPIEPHPLRFSDQEKGARKQGGNVNLALIVEEMLKRFSERWSVWATAGRVLVESFKEIERGCSVSVQGTQLQPELPDAWFRHGRVLALALKHQEAVEALQQGWQLLPKVGCSLQSVPAAVWLGESYQVLGDHAASRKWWQEACLQVKELMTFNPATADYWQGRALERLGDTLGAMEAYRNALNLQLFYPPRREVEGAVKRLQAMVQKSSRA
ncbi:tetratricopeptide repeat protein [Nostoc sp. UHCC 0926]|uniref:tetratricopeptide repeat protein n=1 Tax=unclassified Nostoc TaxID=2593658 RepID=UPI00235F7410|nr:tetratricopeptide repeat protein [Nostoc sp. UHCC 0926]WDD31448.1 tetratricopeptide repeat protein [Nostoc sp. UHCC 0926]